MGLKCFFFSYKIVDKRWIILYINKFRFESIEQEERNDDQLIFKEFFNYLDTEDNSKFNYINLIVIIIYNYINVL